MIIRFSLFNVQVCVCACVVINLWTWPKSWFFTCFIREETCDSCLDVVICVLRIMFKFLLYLRMNEFQMKIYFLFLCCRCSLYYSIFDCCVFYIWFLLRFFSSPLIHSMTEVVTFITYHFFLVFVVAKNFQPSTASSNIHIRLDKNVKPF